MEPRPITTAPPDRRADDTRRTTSQRVLLTAAGIALIAAIGTLDLATGPDIGFSLFYLIPIVASGWWLGRAAAITLAISASVAWLTADVLSHATPSIAVSVWNGLTRFTIFTLIGVLIARQRRDREHLGHLLRAAESLARTDSLTGLSNARAFYERLRSELPRLRRAGAPLCVAYVDLDNFKQVNDRFGHDAGDELLRTIGHLLRRTFRAGDVAARLGGDELAVALWDVEADAAVDACRRLADAIRALEADYPGTGIGASVGVVWLAHPPDDVAQVVGLADRAMYAVKREGKGRVVLLTQ